MTPTIGTTHSRWIHGAVSAGLLVVVVLAVRSRWGHSAPESAIPDPKIPAAFPSDGAGRKKAEAQMQPASSPQEVTAGEEMTPAPEAEEAAGSGYEEAPMEEDFWELETAQLCQRWAQQVRGGETPASLAMAEELRRRGDAAVGELEQQLVSGIPVVEAAALRLLVQMETSRSIAAALVRVCQEPFSDAHPQLRTAFGNSRSRAVAGVLADMVGRETRSGSLENLLAVISTMEGPEIVAALVERLRGEAAETRKQRWQIALAHLSRPSNTCALEAVLGDDPEPAVQAAAAWALARIASRQACELLALHGERQPVFRQALAAVTSPYARETLQEIAAGEFSPAVRAAAAEALAAGGGD